MAVSIAKQFLNAHKRWKSAGKPKRSPERMLEIYKQHCRDCEHNVVKLGIPRCNKCGCCISSNRQYLNKLLFATEACPEDLFPADVVLGEDGNAEDKDGRV